MPPKTKPAVPPTAAPEKPAEVRLHKLERIALQNLLARQTEIQQRAAEQLEPVNRDLNDTIDEICERVGIQKTALVGPLARYELDIQAGVINPLPDPEALSNGHVDAEAAAEAVEAVTG